MVSSSNDFIHYAYTFLYIHLCLYTHTHTCLVSVTRLLPNISTHTHWSWRSRFRAVGPRSSEPRRLQPNPTGSQRKERSSCGANPKGRAKHGEKWIPRLPGYRVQGGATFLAMASLLFHFFVNGIQLPGN